MQHLHSAAGRRFRKLQSSVNLSNIIYALLQADKDGGSADQQELAGVEGVHPGSGRLGTPCALQGVQADRGKHNMHMSVCHMLLYIPIDNVAGSWHVYSTTMLLRSYSYLRQAEQ